jgi:hypothetical protein
LGIGALQLMLDRGELKDWFNSHQASDWFIEAILSIRRRAGMLELYQRIHGLTVPRAALCLSGGRIRSASFALGVRLSPPTGLLRHFRLRQYSLVRT